MRVFHGRPEGISDPKAGCGKPVETANPIGGTTTPPMGAMCHVPNFRFLHFFIDSFNIAYIILQYEQETSQT